MTIANLNNLVEKLSIIINREIKFNNLKIRIDYVKRAKHPKNWVIDSHYHPWFEFNYISKGSVYTTVNGKEFLINSGESYIIPPDIPHSHRNNNTGDDGICIRFTVESDNKNNVLATLSKPRASAFVSGIDKLHLSEGIFSMQGEFTAWLMRLYDIWNTDREAIPPESNSFASQVIFYLEKYYAEKIKTDDIANALNTSYRTLSRKFKAETGTTLSKKLTEIRITKAKQLLISTKLSIYDIARRCGYENEFYFSLKFKECEDISPSMYRHTHFIPISAK